MHRGAAVAAVLVPAAIGATPAPASPVADVLSVSAMPLELTYGAPLTVAGTVTAGGQGVGGASLALQSEAYPFRGFLTAAHLTTAPDGSFAFAGARPDRNTRLRVLLEGSPTTASATLRVTVDPAVALGARELGPGRTRLSMRVHHMLQRGSPAVDAWWFTAARGSRRFHLAAVTRTRETRSGSSGITYAEAIVDPPSKRFIYRVCINPSWERAMGPPATHRPCPRADFTVARATVGPSAYQVEGRGTPSTPYPSAGAIAAARRFLDARAGRTSFAVLDSSGHLGGVRLHERFQSASVVKAMMLVAYLQMLDARHRGLGSADMSLLYPMIHISDNNAASAVLGIVGGAALARLARETGMSDYAPGIGWWAFTQTSAADQARFMFALDRLVPRQFYGYARGLLAGIEPSQSWGIPPVARPRWQVFFKTGALPSEGLFNEVARLERPGRTFTIAVFTTGDPSMIYGEQTIEGVAVNLLRSPP